jgi:hypothetical protein
MAIATRTTDEKARLTLPGSFANCTVLIEQVSDTEIRIRKARVIPEDELPFVEESMAPLSDRDRDIFLALLENPPPPNEALRQLMDQGRERRRLSDRLSKSPREVGNVPLPELEAIKSRHSGPSKSPWKVGYVHFGTPKERPVLARILAKLVALCRSAGGAVKKTDLLIACQAEGYSESSVNDCIYVAQRMCKCRPGATPLTVRGNDPAADLAQWTPFVSGDNDALLLTATGIAYLEAAGIETPGE